MPLIPFSAASTNCGIGLKGYDPVAFFTDNKPVKGNGHHVAEHEGLNYLFIRDEHKKAFQASPEKL